MYTRLANRICTQFNFDSVETPIANHTFVAFLADGLPLATATNSTREQAWCKAIQRLPDHIALAVLVSATVTEISC